ncbi:hypothetical protein pb186bvf_011934 [Paramecium bursaria]
MNHENNYNYLFKYIIVGDSSVGKSCLLMQFTENKFQDHTESTVGVEFGYRTIKVQDQNIKLQIWDTAGQESFKSITRSYYRGSIGGILVFDFTRRATFNNIKKWLQEIKTYSCDQIELVLVGNKCDLETKREVTVQEVQEYANQEKLDFFETSAKTGKNVEVVFEIIANKVYRKIQTRQINLEDQIYGIKANINGSSIRKSTRQKSALPLYQNQMNGKNHPQEVKGKCC